MVMMVLLEAMVAMPLLGPMRATALSMCMGIMVIIKGKVSNLKLHSFYLMDLNLLKPTGYMMHQQFNIQQLYILPTLYLCVLYLSENKQRLVPLTA